MPQAIRRSWPAFPIEAKILFVEDGFEKLALPPGTNQVRRSWYAQWFPQFSGGHGLFFGMVAAYKRASECMSNDGIQIIMFTHQSGSIWADMANIVWESGLQVCGR